MSIYVGGVKATNAVELIKRVLLQIQPKLALKNETKVTDLLKEWVTDRVENRRFRDQANLILAIGSRLQFSLEQRANFFFMQEGENKNIAKVISHSVPAYDSVGWTEREFFADLGHERHRIGSVERNAEQEYLMQGMIKGAMYEAARFANLYSVGISVRPTGVLAHQGIESGNPTKAQEFKNKTSKEEDLFLCDELEWKDLGAVVHYDPRAGWHSQPTSRAFGAGALAKIKAKMTSKVTLVDWQKKKNHIETVRLKQLESTKARLNFWPKSEPDWNKLYDLFKSRAAEYAEEDYEYRYGHYAEHAEIVGPFVRLKKCADMNMVGDHDLFGFTTVRYGLLTLDTALGHVQAALQKANQFQAQHGGIWNWQPSNPFNVGIKTKIMGAHRAQRRAVALHPPRLSRACRLLHSRTRNPEVGLGFPSRPQVA